MTSTERNKAIVRQFYHQVLNRKQLDAIDTLCAPTYHGDAPGADRAAFKQFYGRFLAAFPDLRVSFEEVIAEGDRVVVRATARGTHRGEFLGVPATGTQVSWTGISITRLVDGQIVEQTGEQDFLGVLRQLRGGPS